MAEDQVYVPRRPPTPVVPYARVGLIPPVLTPEQRAALTSQQRAKVRLAESARKHNLSPEVILGPRQDATLVAVRKRLIADIFADCPAWSLPRIGRFINRDHTTVLHHLRKMGLRR